MDRVIVILRRGPQVSLEFPEGVERSCYGAIRLYPGIPKTLSGAELKHLEKHRPDCHELLSVRPYVESQRVDKRGCTESELNQLAESNGLGHLPISLQLQRLKEKGKLPLKKDKAPETAPERPERERRGRR